MYICICYVLYCRCMCVYMCVAFVSVCVNNLKVCLLLTLYILYTDVNVLIVKANFSIHLELAFSAPLYLTSF